MVEITEFIVLLAILFFIPKILARFTIPQTFSEILLGIVLGPTLFYLFEMNSLIELMGTIGIITLFFIAGFEVDFDGIKEKRKTLQQNFILHLVLIFLFALLIFLFTGYGLLISVLIGLALLTPSAGFIIASLKSLRLGPYLLSWIEAKVVTTEMLSLLLLLVILKISTPLLLLQILIMLALLFYMVPVFLRFFFKQIVSKVHGSETFFIFVICITLAFITHLIGLHYIIGAFLFGLIVSKFEVKDAGHKLVINHEKIENTFRSFAAIFAPFYFFAVGLKITSDFFDYYTVLIAAGIFVLVSFIKIGMTFLHRTRTIDEGYKSSLMVAFLTSPTLLFTFVIAEILLAEHYISSQVYSLLIIYGLLSAIIPMFAYNIKLSSEEEFA